MHIVILEAQYMYHVSIYNYVYVYKLRSMDWVLGNQSANIHRVIQYTYTYA